MWTLVARLSQRLLELSERQLVESRERPLVALIEARWMAHLPTVNGRDHDYLSTACLHGVHGQCRKTCKFCPATCWCPCHNDERRSEQSKIPSGGKTDA